MKEFSKIMIICFGLIWLRVAFWGMEFCQSQPEYFPDLLMFIGAPMTAGLVGYLCKAGFENVKKIKNSINERDG